MKDHVLHATFFTTKTVYVILMFNCLSKKVATSQKLILFCIQLKNYLNE